MSRLAFHLLDVAPAEEARAPVRQKRTKEKGPVILARRVGGTLVGAADMDVEMITHLDAIQVVQIRVTQERHVARHRLYWALLSIVCRNLDQPMRPEQLHGAVKLMLGVSVVVTLPGCEDLPQGGDFLLPGSIAFDSMSEAAFRDFLDRFLDLVAERLLPGVDIRALEAQGRTDAATEHAPAGSRKRPPTLALTDASSRTPKTPSTEPRR